VLHRNKIELLIILLSCLGWVEVFAQVSFRPTMIFVSENQKIQEITISSQSDTLQEVEFSTSFGFPIHTDKDGLYIDEGDENDRILYDLTPYVRIFPQKIQLGPRQRQIVRLQVLNSPQFGSGTYWTRLSIKSQVAEPEAQEQLVPNGRESTNINLVVRQNIGVFYKHGEVTTSLDLLRLNYRQEGDILYVEPFVRRMGNSPFIGSLEAQLFSPTGELVSESSIIVNAFFETLTPTRLNVFDLESGQYRLVLSYTTTRGDATGNRLVMGTPLQIEQFIPIRLGGGQ
jgi:P pilus assembly chaperone PapD